MGEGQDGGARAKIRHPYLCPSPSETVSQFENSEDGGKLLTYFGRKQRCHPYIRLVRHSKWDSFMFISLRRLIATQSLEGKEIGSRPNFNRFGSYRCNSLVIFLYLVALLFVSTDACAQLKKIRLCAPGLGSGIMHAYIAKERGYFAQEGLDFDVLVTRGQICTMALLNGQMELSSNPNVFDAMVAGRFKG